MRRPQLLSALVASLWLAVAAAGQTPPPATLAAPQRSHLEEDRFQNVTAIRGLPLGVRDALQALFESRSLDIADPGGQFQGTDVVVDPSLPRRRLVAAGCSSDHCLVYYERGGIAHTWHVALFHWTPAATRLEAGGAAPAGLATIGEVRNAIVNGKIKTGAAGW